MKNSARFSVSPKWKMVLHDMGLDPVTVLTHAQLPLDLFSRENSTLSAVEYFQLWHGLDKATGDQEVALLIGEYCSAESFDAPIFAALCCPNLNTAAKRLSEYKPLIGPITLDVDVSNTLTKLTIGCAVKGLELPSLLGFCEAVFFAKLARIATRDKICPVSVTVPKLPEDVKSLEDFLGCEVKLGSEVVICFSAKDAQQPFLTCSGSMWDFFEEKLSQKLADLTANTNTADRVRAVLIESLPSGNSSLDFVAQRLAMSRRTLQRKLTDEVESFQSILVQVREELAQHYLERSNISLAEISYLLGFKEPNSFIRAFNDWKGVSPSSYRSQTRH